MGRPGHFCTTGLKAGTVLHICGTELGRFCTSAERSRDGSAHLQNGVGTLLHICGTESGQFCTSASLRNEGNGTVLHNW